jgi:hypothetical protein
MRRPILTLFACVFAITAPGQEEKKDAPEGGGEAPGEDVPEEKPADDAGSRADPIDYIKYIEVLEAKHNPAAKDGEKSTIGVKFNLSPEVPKGTKINFEFEYVGTEFENVDYVLKDENRKGLALLWKPTQRLGTGEYFIRVRMHPDQQTPAVLRLLAQNEKSFPAKDKPWVWYFYEQPIQVGSKDDEAEENEALCKAYTDFVDKLVANMVEFVDKMDEVKAGKAFVSGNALDAAKLKEYVVEWRKKQGEVQKEIIEFQDKERALFQRSLTTYQNLIELGRMVSKRSRDLLFEVCDKYKVEKMNPAGHERFDLSYRYKVTLDEMNRRMETISNQVCPKEAEPEPEDGGEDGGDAEAKKAKEGEKDAGEAAAEAGKDEEKPKSKDKKKPAGKKKPSK